MKYKNPSLSVQERVNDLLPRMTLEEKIAQCIQIYIPPDHPGEIVDRIQAVGLGSRILGAVSLAGNVSQRTAGIEDLNEIQRIAMNEFRLGIPVIHGLDVIHGLRVIFPIPLGLAATFDPDAIQKTYNIAAEECSRLGVHWSFAPMLDIAHDPRWGRIVEGFGEDPYLGAKMAVAAIKGFQGELDENGYQSQDHILACAKHYIGYGGAEGGRDYNTAEITDHTLRNIYLPPFRAAVQAGVGSVMSAFEDLNGEPASGSRYLLTDLLKEELGFNGFVISDWASVAELIHHRVAANEREAAQIAFDAGVDMEMVTECYAHHLADLVMEGIISMERLDDAVRRILTQKFQLGLFDHPYADVQKSLEIRDLSAYHIAAREVTARSMVLLKNNGILPLPGDVRRIALIGPFVNQRRALLGTWVNDVLADEPQTLEEALRASCPDVEILTAPNGLTDEMIMIAAEADVVLLALGESNARNGEYNSIASLNLPAGQEELAQAVAGMGKPLAVLVFAGRPVTLTRILPHADALLYAWHPGSMGAAAAVDILLGKVNPAGKLPVTFPRGEGQIPVHYNHKSTGRDHPRYLDMPVEPLFPFGFGLSYTRFEITDLVVEPVEIPAGASVNVSVTVTNTGECKGEEVVQCYLQDCVSRRTRPERELKGFQRIALQPGESRRVEFTLGPDEMSYYGAGGSWVLEPGAFKVWIGNDCKASLEGSFLLK